MTCAACQANITRAVSRLPGVESVDVSLISNTMKVDYDKEQTSLQDIEQAVQKIGYGATPAAQEGGGAAAPDSSAQWQARQEKTEKEIAEKKRSLIASIVLLLVLMCFSMLPMLGVFTFFMDMEWMMVSSIIQLILCMAILFIQRSFFTHGFKALWHRAPNMDSLVAVGSAVSFGYSIYGILRMAYGYGIMDHAMIHSSMDALYFEGAAMIVTLVSLGKYLEARSKKKTGDALSKLVDLAPKTALIEENGKPKEVPAAEVRAGDTVIIRPGTAVPVDGVVLSGIGYVDQAAITGESIPVEKQPGDTVMAATMNVNGSFTFRATRVGSDTTLSQIIRLVDEAGSSKAPIARLADKVAGVFVPAVMGIALVTLIGWLIAGGSIGFAINCAVSVLVISCPCALGLATPLAIMVSTGKAAEYGVLIKSATALETLHSINTIVLDKTGTITSGKPVLTGMTIFTKDSEDEVLALAAAAESGSEHPLAKAIVEAAHEKNLALPAVSSFEAVGGRGLKAMAEGRQILAGNQAFMKEENIPLPEPVKKALEEAAGQGQTPMLFAVNGRIAFMLCVADTVRPTSREALHLLRQKGIQVVMLTGDNAITAKAIAKDLDVDDVIADVLPAQKESVIRELQEKGRKVAMVGDGINDAPALTRADVGIAIGAGTDIAVESADVVLMKDNLLDVVTAIDLSRATIRNIKENLFWAFFYNCLGIPVAMGLLYPFTGITLNPMIGAAAMSLSSVTVCLNALRLRFFRPSGTAAEQKEEKVSRQAVAVARMELAQADQILEEQARREEENSAVLGVEGMSCEHCVSRVKAALEDVPGVQSAIVSLNPGRAFVLESRPVDPEALMEAVRQAGYEPVLLDADGLQAGGPANQGQPEPAGMDLSAVKMDSIDLDVSGMSCAHCVSHVQQALMAVPGVESAQVSLDPGRAMVQTNGRVDAQDLIRAVEEAGYEAKAAGSQTDFQYRLQIGGMSCAHCVEHVDDALNTVEGVLDTKVTLDPPQAWIRADRALQEKNVEQAVEEAGYHVERFERIES